MLDRYREQPHPVSFLPDVLWEALPLVLIGMPGSGKSTVGRELAKRLGIEHIDTDSVIEKQQHRPIAQIFSEEGETAFREYEAEAVAEALTQPAVVSLGGGAVTTASVRNLLRHHTVVYIDAPLNILRDRVSTQNTRPLLLENPAETLQRLYEERQPLFEDVATLTVASDASPVSTVIARILDALLQTRRVIVHGERPYEVVLQAADTAFEIRAALSPSTTRVLIIHSDGVTAYSQRIASSLEAYGISVHRMIHPDGEQAKTVEVLAHAWGAAAAASLSRHDAIIAIGGGATTDLAGFVAATWLRGIDVIHIPTTVLAMVDAAVGGKTGINTAAGKNLAGAFHPPLAVIADIHTLGTLSLAERRAGLGEVVKCGFIADREILSIIDTHSDVLQNVYSPQLAELIYRAVQVKAQVVSEDLKESGLREILNYGHTLAHAIETCENYTWRHGEAVAVGCIFAAELARERGMLNDTDIELHRRAFESLGLPTSYSGASLDELFAVMCADKKVRSGNLRFVLLDGIGNPVTLPVDREELRVPAQRIGIRV